MAVVIFKPDACLLDQALHYGYGAAVENGEIIAVNTIAVLEKTYPDAVSEPWKGLVLVPGAVNAHNHSFQSLLRGIAVDRPFLEWRDQSLYRFSPKMRVQDIYAGALFAFTEMLKRGVTTVCDFFYLHNQGIESDEAVIQAAADAGIRLVLARTMYDWKGAPAGYVEDVRTAVYHTEMLMKKYSDAGMVKVLPAPHSLHAASTEMIVAGYKLARKYGTPYHIHVAEELFEVQEVQKEHGMRPLEYLDSMGVVDASMVIIHGVWLEDSEIKTLGEKGGQLVYCPSSNMFLADGVTDIPAFMKYGASIALGSDGGCSNNRISIFEEMRMVSILQKVHRLDALCVNYQDAFCMGTSGGAKALDLKIGQLKEGYKADFTGIILRDLSMQPISQKGKQFLPNLVYSMEPTAIGKVVVNGRTTVSDGKLATVAEETVLHHVWRTMDHLEK
ncbi:amidohydrolase family protein|uniref:5-methylthioadenosine/S-adenosylhomocysteine deaminase n=1 Tax=Dendrosporobacter quercicolus TaxID=146817 RepID=A0A1G9SLN6_9FIRM|nr:amidohydrolase family protein [Dendrosporobacter quercicolus]NSL48680.1 amidohydrolase family protein [Dendrosporobacter quercicolus DSM 1736]SDM36217.1 5-methylthioadenosine/S-adenosylhomocysteine deaminase [Dendrosporobacter quercicolus]